MTAEIGELPVEEYLSLATSAGRGRNNVLLERAMQRHGSRREAIDSARQFLTLVEEFAWRFGEDRRICLFESPGRVNLMGMHIDHRGGTVNPVATRERIRVVCGRREDDLIRARSLSNHFGEGELHISDRLPERPPRSLGEWLNWTEREAITTGGGKQFINYFACGPLYAACFHYPWGQKFVGADFVLDSDLPPSAGLSSSSAIVVLATECFFRANPRGVENLSPDQRIEIYGNGEWYIGTRGGKGDHAAITLSRRGTVLPMITTPDFLAGEPAPIPKGYDIILYPSGDHANKSVEPFTTAYNAPIIAYQAAEMMLTDFLRARNRHVLDKLLAERASMDAKHRRAYLGDVINGRMLSDAELYRFLQSLPCAMTRDEIFSRFDGRAESFQNGIHQTHEPEGGYRIRDVTAFGLSECIRGKQAGRLLAANDVEAFADMMNVSQFGDRVSRLADRSMGRVKFLQDDVLIEMEKEGFPLQKVAGDYHVSTANVDRLVTLCLDCPDVLGARLSGAGLGGMLIVLGKEGFDEALDPILLRGYYEPLAREFRKIHIVPSEGAGFY